MHARVGPCQSVNCLYSAQSSSKDLPRGTGAPPGEAGVSSGSLRCGGTLTATALGKCYYYYYFVCWFCFVLLLVFIFSIIFSLLFIQNLFSIFLFLLYRFVVSCISLFLFLCFVLFFNHFFMLSLLFVFSLFFGFCFHQFCFYSLFLSQGSLVVLQFFFFSLFSFTVIICLRFCLFYYSFFWGGAILGSRGLVTQPEVRPK